MKTPLFEEKQKFGYNGIWFAVLGLFLLAIYAFVQLSLIGVSQIYLIAMIPSITLLFYLLMLFRRFELTIVVNKKALEFQFIPSQKEVQVVEWKFVKHVDLREFSALRHFGGWNVRHGDTRAYTIGGSKGVEITFTNGRKLLLGSKEPERLYQAIREAKKGN